MAGRNGQLGAAVVPAAPGAFDLKTVFVNGNPGAPDDVKLPLFLEAFTWVDLRDGLKQEGLDKLEWGITGVKPNP